MLITGIYKLIFVGTNKVYIGQSVDITGRFSRHIRDMTKGKATNKLQSAYNLYGKPTLEILSECSKEQLNEQENETIEIYDSVENGFNTYDAARNYSTNSGIHHYNSKYSESQILDTFFAILNPEVNFKDISNNTGVSIGSINVLSRGASHKYLEELYPEEYSKMLSLIGSRRKFINSSERLGKIYPTIVSPEGVEYSSISNVTEFAKEHGLDVSGLYLVLNKAKNRVSVGGWRLK